LSDPKGKFEVVKNRLNDYVTSAVGGTVSNNWRIGIELLTTLPISTIRIDPATLIDENYDRRTPERGCWVIYEFTIFVHDEAITTYLDTTPKFYKAMDDADNIMDELISKSEDATEKTDYQIYRIYDLRLDYTQPDRRARNLGRMIVSGRLKAKWLEP